MAVTYEPIATSTLSTSAASITFSSIPSTYTDLRLIVSMNDASGNTLSIQFNSDYASNYSTVRLNGNGSTASSAVFSNQTGFISGVSAYSAGYYTLQIFDIMNYAGSTFKQTLNTSADLNNNQVRNNVHLWRSTAAINTIKIEPFGGGTLIAGCTATIYGIKAA